MMEKLSKKDQMELISKTDVLIGVHGNGLTNEIWMKPGGAVLESEYGIERRKRRGEEERELTSSISTRFPFLSIR